MHIPDGFLSMPVWVLLYVVSAAFLANGLRKAKKVFGDKHIPMMGVLAAFIFAAQMLNFPVAGGTSGHFMGGALAAVFLGPYSAGIIMSLVLFVQAVVFQDGGLTALGANIFNMGIVGAVSAYWVFSFLKEKQKNTGVAVGVAAWSSIVLAALACSLELAFSQTIDFSIVLPAMVGVHALIGIGEAAITLLVFQYVSKTRPDLLELKKL